MTEKTDIHPSFGVTLEQAIHTIQLWILAQDTNDPWESKQHPAYVLNINPHAIKVLQQHPEIVNPWKLSWNPSHEAVDLMKALQLHPFHYTRTLFSNAFSILDTYLKELQGKYAFTESDYFDLSRNPCAVPFLQRNPEKIHWDELSRNPEAIDLLEQNPEKINFYQLSANTNPRAIALLRDHLEHVNWQSLSMNPCNEAVDLLLEHPDKIDYYRLVHNTNPRAIQLLRNHPIENWQGLTTNRCHEALEILTENKDHIKWGLFCVHASTKEQFAFLRANLDRVDWSCLCLNPSDRAVDLLKEHPHRMDWLNSLSCQNVFETVTEYDYAGIRESRRFLHEEFHAWAGHPSKITTHWKDWGFDEEEEEEEEDDATVEN